MKSILTRIRHFKSLTKPKILIQRSDKLGDNIFIGPAIEQLYAAFPHADIDLLTSAVGADLYKHHPHLHAIRVLDPRVLTHWLHWLKEVNHIKNQHYDVYISFWNTPRLAWLGLASLIPIRCGDASSFLLKFCYNHPITLPWNNLTYHQIDFNCALLSGLNLPKTPMTRHLYPDPNTQQQLFNQWPHAIDPSKKVLVILCGTGGSSTAISSEVIIKWIDHYFDSSNYHCILVGQLDHYDPLTNYSSDVIWNRINHTTLSELIAIINLSDYVIGADTGPSHIASFLNKPMIFYSPLKRQSPSSWGPFSDQAIILRHDYLLPDESRAPFIQHLDDAFQELTQHANHHYAKTDQEKRFRLLRHSIRVLLIDETPSRFDLTINARIHSLQSQGLITFQYTIQGFWLMNLVSLIRLIYQRNITILISATMPFGMLSIIRFIMGTVFQYRMPILILTSELNRSDLASFWKICLSKKW